MANEDTTLERAVVKKLESRNILSVCGSGARALALLNSNTQRLHCVDLSSQQLSLARLRLALIKKLELQEYQKFWGYAPYSPKDNRALRKEILLSLEADEEDRKLWNNLHENSEWESLLYKGKWESSFAFFGKLTQALFGHKALDFFQFTDLDAQREYLRKSFPRKRWNSLVRVIGNRATFNALLYKGDFIQKNVEQSYFDYYSSAFERLFTGSLVRENFFLQLCMLGAIRFPEGNIIEAHSECYADMKSNASSCEIEFYQEDIINRARKLQETEEKYDYVSISDVPSYFSGETEKNFLQEIKPSMSKGGVVLVRSYLRVPDADRSGFKDISSEFQNEIALEKTQMYQVEILQKL